MMAMSKKMLDQEPSEIEMLLPFHAAGTLNARDTRRVDEALASDEHVKKNRSAHPKRRQAAALQNLAGNVNAHLLFYACYRL